MYKDVFNSFKENIKQKSTNPFLGTVIVVWIFQNYEDLYKLLISGENLKFSEKIDVLNKLFDHKQFIINLLICVLIAVGVLIGTYFLINLSRLIIDFFEKIVAPWASGIIDKNSIVDRSKYDFQVNLNEDLRIKLDEEKEKRRNVESDYDKLRDSLSKESNPIRRKNSQLANMTDVQLKDKSLIFTKMIRDELKKYDSPFYLPVSNNLSGEEFEKERIKYEELKQKNQQESLNFFRENIAEARVLKDEILKRLPDSFSEDRESKDSEYSHVVNSFGIEDVIQDLEYLSKSLEIY